MLKDAVSKTVIYIHPMLTRYPADPWSQESDNVMHSDNIDIERKGSCIAEGHSGLLRI